MEGAEQLRDALAPLAQRVAQLLYTRDVQRARLRLAVEMSELFKTGGVAL
jgi:hypothetical protein